MTCLTLLIVSLVKLEQVQQILFGSDYDSDIDIYNGNDFNSTEPIVAMSKSFEQRATTTTKIPSSLIERLIIRLIASRKESPADTRQL